MDSLLEFINTRMQPVAEKAILADLLLAQQEMPDAEIPVMPAVPQCMFDDNENIVARRVIILAWIQLRRENPTITKEEVAGMISFHDRDAFADFMERVYWFWSDLPRDRFDEIFGKLRETISVTPLDTEEPEAAEEVAEVNPTPSESS
jgi:hypothetical protein